MMLEHVTEAQIASYRENGFLILDDLLTPAELEQWRREMDDAVEQRLAALAEQMASGKIKAGLLDKSKARLRDLIGKQRVDRIRQTLVRLLGKDVTAGAFNDFLLTNQGDPDSYAAQVLVVCQRLADTHTGTRAMAMDERLGRIVSDLTGAAGVRYYHDQALIKPPFGSATAWHLDNTTWSFHSPQSLTLWVALDDATLANGCLWYLPGTQATSTLKNVNVAAKQGDLLKLYPEWRGITPAPAVLRAGSAVLHSGCVAHGAGANMTNLPRRAYTVSYMPLGATFNGIRDVLAADYFKTLRVGDSLDSEAIHPRIWARESAERERAPALTVL